MPTQPFLSEPHAKHEIKKSLVLDEANLDCECKEILRTISMMKTPIPKHKQKSIHK